MLKPQFHPGCFLTILLASLCDLAPINKDQECSEITEEPAEGGRGRVRGKAGAEAASGALSTLDPVAFLVQVQHIKTHLSPHLLACFLQIRTLRF